MTLRTAFLAFAQRHPLYVVIGVLSGILVGLSCEAIINPTVLLARWIFLIIALDALPIVLAIHYARKTVRA